MGLIQDIASMARQGVPKSILRDMQKAALREIEKRGSSDDDDPPAEPKKPIVAKKKKKAKAKKAKATMQTRKYNNARALAELRAEHAPVRPSLTPEQSKIASTALHGFAADVEAEQANEHRAPRRAPRLDAMSDEQKITTVVLTGIGVDTRAPTGRDVTPRAHVSGPESALVSAGLLRRGR